MRMNGRKGDYNRNVKEMQDAQTGFLRFFGRFPHSARIRFCSPVRFRQGVRGEPPPACALYLVFCVMPCYK